MCPLRLFQNPVVFTRDRAAFTDVYPNSPYRDVTCELANLGSVVPVDAGHFHLEVIWFLVFLCSIALQFLHKKVDIPFLGSVFQLFPNNNTQLMLSSLSSPVILSVLV
jgi:hypothetical protein